MHACGHDIHSSSLLAVAGVLKELINKWEGTIHYVFQHAEELIPGGAKLMLQENLFGDNQPEFVIAQHVDPEITVGKFGFKTGRYMASNDEVYLTILGKGGHGAMPHKIDDTVLSASQVLVNLQQISSRLVPAGIPMVLSFGKFIADGATNVIPSEVKIEGTFRTFDEQWRLKAHQHIKNIAESTAVAYGTTCEVEIRHGYPVVENNDVLYNKAKQLVVDSLGKDAVIDLDYRMTSEDFGYFSQQYKSLFYRLGVGFDDDSKNYPLHSPKFNPDENALQYSIEFMSNLAVELLS
jgi:amidohydrolase